MKLQADTKAKDFLENLNWRYATKKFDPAKKIPEDELADLLDAIRLTPSSYGLQPYRVLVIRDPSLRERLRPACWDQSQVTDASHVLVFASRADFDGELIDSYLEEVSDTRGIPVEDLSGYGEFMKSRLLPIPAGDKAEWSARQAYIALGNLLTAAAALRIDACPMEGFDADQVDEILGLKEINLTATLIAPIGYRSPEDNTQFNQKVRRPESEFFIHL